MPGIGKTALAVHAGHLLAAQFPDAQLFINLHGLTAGQPPMHPADALYELLTTDGVSGPNIPVDLDARAALWRRRMAGKRALLVLDNVDSRQQVEHLLPGSAGCLVLITSRRRLTGIGAYHAAESVPLDVLDPAQATALFARLAGRDPQGAEIAAVEELVCLCGHLPLAICLLAAKLKVAPHSRVADLVRDLQQAEHRLSHMRAEDLAVEAAFHVSYRRLSAPRKRFFRRIALHPGTEFDSYAAAALDGIAPNKAQWQLEALYQENLLYQPRRNRYRMHDLISEYARTLANSDPDAPKAQALARLLDYYQAGAAAADQHLSRPGRQQAVGPTDASVAPPEISTREEALTWMDAERTNLFACATLLSTGPEYGRLITLTASMAAYLRQSGPWDHAMSLHQMTASAAQEAHNRQAYAAALHELGNVRRLAGDYEAAMHDLQQALEMHDQLNHQRGKADTLTQLAGIRWRTGDCHGAARELERALAMYENLGDLYGQADVLDELGVVRHLTDDRQAAVLTLRKALAIHRATGDLQGQANALSQLAMAQELTGGYLPAIRAHRQALVIYQCLGDRFGQARALNYLGATLCLVGDYPAAENALNQALSIHQKLGYRAGQANALNYLSVVHCQVGAYAEADSELAQALALYRDLPHPAGEANLLNQLGILRRLTGDHQAAEEAHEQAMVIFRQRNDHLGQAEVLNELGQLYLDRGQAVNATECHENALVLARRASSPRDEARAIEGVGRCMLALGNVCDAKARLLEAMGIYERIDLLVAARAVASLLPDSTITLTA
jgi:tetratricopeptide (TPR) repeat protein